MADTDRPWFYHPAGFVAGARVSLDAEEARHALGSLRLRPGDPVTLADGRGLLADGRVAAIERRHIEVTLEGARCLPAPRPLWLAPALIRGPRFDLLVEKATELGVAGIAPLVTRRTEIRPGGGREKPERWLRLGITALKQSHRAWLPEIREPAPLAAFLGGTKSSRLTVAHPAHEDTEGTQTIIRSVVVGDASRVTLGAEYLLVGPEGGWHPEELELLAGAGARWIHLGPTRLRAETAALALLGFALSEGGVFGERHDP